MWIYFAAFLAAGPAAAEPWVNPTPVRTIYVVAGSHLDIGFTDTPRAVAAKYVDAIDHALDLAAADPAYVWNVETFWQLQQWLDRPASADRLPALLALVRARRLGIGGAFVSPHPFVMGSWSLDRLCVPATQWAAANGLAVEWAWLDDVPGYPPELPAALARCGIRYLMIGANQGFTPKLPTRVADTPFWWQAPSGERVLTFISGDSYTAAYTHLGIDPGTARFFARERFAGLEGVAVMEKGIGRTLRKLRQRDYPYDAFLTLHAFDNWGSDAAKRLPKAARDWNAAHGDAVTVKVTTPLAFFEHIEQRYGNELPVRRGGFGGEWDTLRHAIPTTMARLRAAEARLAAAETVAPQALRRLLTGYGHSNGLGPGWPKMFTLEQTIEHNRWWADLASTYPAPAPLRTDGAKPTNLTDPPDADVRTNALYEGKRFLYDFGLGQTPTLLDRSIGTSLPPLRLADGTLRLRHRIDRLALHDGTNVVWAWRLPPEDLAADPRIETARGWMTLPRDDLRSDAAPPYWVSPRRTRLGRTTIAANTILILTRKLDRRPDVLLALCLRQSRQATLKDGTKHRLTFEQAYPGEDPVFELVIDVRRTP